MDNPFDLINLVPTWVKATEILKGDVPGHPFHGNQWEAGEEANKTAQELSIRGQLAKTPEEHRECAKQHTQLSNYYKSQIERVGQKLHGFRSDPDRAGELRTELEALKVAAYNHAVAAQTHTDEANGKLKNGYEAKGSAGWARQHPLTYRHGSDASMFAARNSQDVRNAQVASTPVSLVGKDAEILTALMQQTKLTKEQL